jgi:threonine synthase
MTNYVSHLECAYSGKRYEPGEIHTVSEIGKPIVVKYDLEKISEEVPRSSIEQSREPGFWRYSPLLPVSLKKNRVTLGEVVTPLISLDEDASIFGSNSNSVMVKDESRLPTGSFKARGLGMAVSMAKELGVRHLAIPTNGNAGSALAAYASRAGIECTVMCPDNTPEINVREAQMQGASTHIVNGLIGECGKVISDGVEDIGWFAVSTLKEPYRIEGKKTMGLELAEQMGWKLPDVIFYPTGGGTGIIGMWKCFQELTELGWINCKMPRMVAVQSTGCAPIVRAWNEGKEFAEYWEDAETISSGIRVPSALGDFLILDAVRSSDGFAISVSDEETLEMQYEIGLKEGLLLCPEGAATAVAYRSSLSSGLVSRSDSVVLFNTATGLKYPMPEVGSIIDKDNVDYSSFRTR